MAVPADTRKRLNAEGVSGDSFRPDTAAKIIAWARSSSSHVPEREQVITTARHAIDDGVLSDGERQKLVAKGYRELDD